MTKEDKKVRKGPHKAVRITTTHRPGDPQLIVKMPETQSLQEVRKATAMETKQNRQYELCAILAVRLGDQNKTLLKLCGQTVELPIPPEMAKTSLDAHDAANQWFNGLVDTLSQQAALFEEMI